VASRGAWGFGSTADIAAANGSCRNAGSRAIEPSPGASANVGGISALIRVVMNAAMPALPSTEPTCRVVL
jgi:hypothetical protein